jgi:hypothetical protein
MLMVDAGGRPMKLAWVGLGFALIDAGPSRGLSEGCA